MTHLTQNDLAILSVTCFCIALIGAMAAMYFILKYQEVKKQSNVDSGVIASGLTKILNQNIDLEIYKDTCKQLREERTELRESFTKLAEENKRLKAKLSHKDQTRDSKGHFIKVKPIEADKWQCIKRMYPQFEQGKEYLQDKTIYSSNDGLFWLFEKELDLHPYLVEKKYFKPVI
jgi:predicted nuclease with TOPRIM domain